MICPNCKSEFRQRKNEACPACDEPLQIYNGMAYRTSLGSPTVALLEHFERHVSRQTSEIQKKQLVFRIPRGGPRYRRELAESQKLLDLCDGDYDAAAETLDVLFTNKQFKWRSYVSLIGIQKVFLLAKVVGDNLRAERQQADALQAAYFERIMQQENIFSQL
jgi:hypothetical protein